MDETTGTPTPPPPSTPAPPAAPEPPSGASGPASDTSKLLAALGYLFGVVAVIALLIEPYKNEPWLKLHAFQAIALWIIGIVASWIPVVGWVLSIVIFVFAIMGLIKAFQGQRWEAPLIYDFVKGWVD